MWTPTSAIAQTNQAVPVVTAIEDSEDAIAPTLQIRSDGGGFYTTSKVLQSIIQPGGDWELDTNLRGSTRGFTVDFSQPVPGSGPGGGAPIAPAAGIYHARFISKCHVYGNDLLAITGGQTVDCPLTTSFSVDGVSYRIQMNPRTGVAVYPQTDFVTVTCTSPGSNTPCSQWRMEPTGTFTAPDGSLKKRNRANLAKIVTSKGKTIETNQGDFYFSFQIQATRQ
jgi:hypothetical protein